MGDLSNISLFQGLPAEALDALEQTASTRQYPKNTIIINEGDTSTSLYLLIAGKVKVFLSDEEGREFVLNSLSPGDYFGEYALLDDEQRTASVMTTDTSSFLIIHKEDFQRLRNDYADMSEILINNLVGRIRQLTDNVKTLALKDVYGRIRKLLGDLSEKSGSDKIEEKLTQQEIANRVGSSREMVARILKDLSVGGYIVSEKKQITLLKSLPENY
ncbi:MAG: Crp/Fnr family transcriptional regulator [Pseudomonadales bacterium]|mgnify:CR=1 FL=1|nr:Crp/Fnr family transcriptional regulator [Pseudomonadales bacterium]